MSCKPKISEQEWKGYLDCLARKESDPTFYGSADVACRFQFGMPQL